MLWIELIIFLSIVIIGSRIGGIAMGTLAGIGLILFIFLFRLPVGSPPIIVLGMILAVITALSAMEAAGGLDYLIAVAEKIMRKRPQNITIVAPIVTYVLVLSAGTQHVIYALLPVIAEIARKSGIRPERPIAMSDIAAMQGIVASPISAATVAMLGILTVSGISLPRILLIVIPSTFIAVIIGSIVVYKKGKELSEDPVYLQRLKEGRIRELASSKSLERKSVKRAKGSIAFFFSAILMVIVFGMFPELRPISEVIKDGTVIEDQVAMGPTIMILMLTVGALMMIFLKADPEKAVTGSVMKSGIVAIVSILGIAWLGSSFFEGNRVILVEGISQLIEGDHWVFGFGLFAMSIMLFSQAATVVTLMPLGLALGLDAELLIALYPAVNGFFFLPTYGTILAAISFDQTGTTKIGKYLLNHSFMIPGLVTTFSAVTIALLITYLI
ncbi:anaerobic C4-dicarboxylate transporter family protein [Lutimonas zeaxanthinifaciens]|uniref:anaerobic C4-dicarboxylate transporter family protein n=1 Tax=Lutimonas zeaxanthinifaciens TaxID=3060215 RepID=UPI00265CE2BF|nr:anaerobic C4-dicarboxylate transporter family protein [Lutimonas sp. YSD2104]WKK64649.1 anaerobic C4-dicarboxylate transporter family protein [Lutimonas sp. YSD2104]